MSREIYNIINILTIAQFLFFSIFLLTQKKGIRVSNIILAFFLISNAMNLYGDVYVFFAEYLYKYLPFLFYLDFPFLFAYSPLLYLYTVSLTQHRFSLKKTHALHLIPFLVAFVYIFLTYHVHSADIQRELLTMGPRYNPLFGATENIYTVIEYIQFSIYAISSLFVLERYHKKVTDYFSSFERINLVWLRFIIYGFLFWEILNLTYFFYHQFTSDYNMPIRIITRIVVLTLAYIVVFRGLRQPEIFVGFQKNSSKRKYEKSHLPKSKRNVYLNYLLRYMKTNKPYLDPSINLHTLASDISISPHHLSQVINECLKQNFFDFINSYRIEECKNLLSDNQNAKKTILEIIYKAGFNSKSVFNSAFKRQTGMTPSEYRNSVTT